jgi:NADPH-dependent 2,4-dienoyl-CoA reductase/sulfur reductase-like enzyme
VKHYKYVIMGSGVAAGHGAQEFVQQNVGKGELAIVTADSVLPYDRPPLSKGFLSGEKSREDILLKDAAFYRENGILVKTRTPVVNVDLARRSLRCKPAGIIGYEKLLIATGSEVRRLNVPGANLKGLFYLRLLADSEAIHRQIKKGKRAVVIGSGFIGMEVASVLAKKGVETTLVFPQDRVWSKFFTPEMSSWFQSYFEKRGVKLLAGAKVKALLGKKIVHAVRLDSGRELPADLVVAGIGVVPAISLFEKTSLEIKDGIRVNEFLETSHSEVWAAGDVTNYPDKIFGKRRRLDHWDNAVEQGRCAVRNMISKPQPFIHVPYFFSDLFDLSYEFWGDTEHADNVIYRGKLDSGKFSVWWRKGERLVAAFIMGRPDEERELAPKWIMEQTKVNRTALEDEKRSLRSSMLKR